jgi:PBP1b-binding outer membrane lipoprotein LpoB
MLKLISSLALLLAGCSTPHLPAPSVQINPFPPTLMVPPQKMSIIPTGEAIDSRNSSRKRL